MTKVKNKPVIDRWQLCPKCNGNGMVYVHADPFQNRTGHIYNHTNWEGHGLFSTSCTCDVCDGKKIISIITGLPPNHD